MLSEPVLRTGSPSGLLVMGKAASRATPSTQAGAVPVSEMQPAARDGLTLDIAAARLTRVGLGVAGSTTKRVPILLAP